MRHPPIDTTLYIPDILGILAHALAFDIGYLRHVLTVTFRSLHDYVESGNIGIVGYVCAYAECNFCPVLKVGPELICSVEIEAVGEQQSLGLRIDAETLIVIDHLVAPLIGISAVMTHTREKCRIGQLEITQEAVCRDRVGKCSTV